MVQCIVVYKPLAVTVNLRFYKMISVSMLFLIFKSILVFQLSSFVTWSYSKTAPVNASMSPASMASTRMFTNLASRVEVKVVSRDPYLDRFRLAVTVSYVAKQCQQYTYEPKSAHIHTFIARAQRLARNQYSFTLYFVSADDREPFATCS